MLFILVAAVLVAALSVLLISDAVKTAESVMLADAGKTLGMASTELGQQSRQRIAADGRWRHLPVAAQDTSLRAISQAVLRSYPGVEGGYYDGIHFLGYSYPTHDSGERKTDVPIAELDDILAAIAQSRTAGTAQRVLRGERDLVVIEARSGDGLVSWTMKRLSGRNDPGGHRREILLSVLVLTALASVAGTLATGVALRRGILQIRRGLELLESDTYHRLPARNDELGEISRSINRMAEARQKLETDLRREDRLRTTGRLVAGIAHEIRNPLNSIRLSVQYLDRRLRSGAARPGDMEPVIAEVDRLDSLLTNLLAFQKGRPVSLQQQPLAPVIGRCVNLIRPQADQRHVRIEAPAAAGDSGACFDAEQLTQVLMNLLLNAVEASGSGGHVGLRVEQREGTVAIQVQDSGPGLTREQEEHLFEAFYTTRPDGTGLGLPVSRELAATMGGTLRYRNGGRGAIFEIELPGSGTCEPTPS